MGLPSYFKNIYRERLEKWHDGDHDTIFWDSRDFERLNHRCPSYEAKIREYNGGILRSSHVAYGAILERYNEALYHKLGNLRSSIKYTNDQKIYYIKYHIFDMTKAWDRIHLRYFCGKRRNSASMMEKGLIRKYINRHGFEGYFGAYIKNPKTKAHVLFNKCVEDSLDTILFSFEINTLVFTEKIPVKGNKSKSYKEKMAIILNRREERMADLEIKSRIYRNRDFKSRIFPPALRFSIFERDNYTCQVCGKHKSNLPKREHLEIDHIIEWEDGGKTSYNNGQTVCSSCNKGKHHSKRRVKS